MANIFEKVVKGIKKAVKPQTFVRYCNVCERQRPLIMESKIIGGERCFLYTCSICDKPAYRVHGITTYEYDAEGNVEKVKVMGK